MLTPLLGRRGRIWCGLLLIVLLAPLVYAYTQLRDNNSILLMLDKKVEDYHYFLDEYLPGFGSGDDDAVYVVFETPNALSDETLALTDKVQDVFEDITLSFDTRPSPTDPNALHGTAHWPWKTEQAPGSLPACLFSAEAYGVTYGKCLRRYILPVEVAFRSDDGGGSWYFEPVDADGSRASDPASAPVRQIPVSCTEGRERCSFNLVLSTFSPGVLQRAMPGDDRATQASAFALLLALGDAPSGADLATPSYKDLLLGKPKSGQNNAAYTIVGTASRIVSLRNRDDVRSVGIAWIQHSLDALSPPGTEFHILGAAAVLAINADEIATTHVTLEPLAIALIFLMVALSIRGSPRLLLIPVCTVIAAVVTTMGLYGLSGGSYNWVVIILPLIIVVTSVSDSIHLVGHYREKCRTCVTREAAFARTVHALLVPCFFTSLTTALGLFSVFLGAESSSSFAKFGLFGAIGVISAFLYSFILFALFAPPVEALRSPAKTSAPEPRMERTPYVAWLFGWRKPIIIVTLALVTASAALWKWVQIDFDYRTWYSDDTKQSQAQKFFDERMSGSNFFPIVVSSPNDHEAACASLRTGTREQVCLTDAQVDALWEIRRKLHPGTGAWAQELIPGTELAWSEASTDVLELAFASSGQPAEVVMRELQCYLDGGVLTLSLFGSKCALTRPSPMTEARAQLVAEQVRAHFNILADPAVRGRHTQVRVLARQGNGSEFQKFVGRLQALLTSEISGEGSGCKATVTGYSYVCTKFLSEVLTKMAWSFGYALVTILATMFILLRRRPLLALLSIVPNIVPFVLLVGFMAATGTPLHFETMMLVAVAMGLVVDDTIQYCHALERALDDCQLQAAAASDEERGMMFRRAITRALESTSYAMVITSLSLIAGFSLFLISDFQMTNDVGLLLMFVVLIALISDLLLFPALLLWLAGSRWFVNRLVQG